MTSPAGALPYGPETPRVRGFLQRLAQQPSVVWLAAARRYAAVAGTEEGRRADQALAEAIRRTGRDSERDALVGPVVQLAARAAAGSPVGAGDAEQVERLAEPALAAALALVVGDVLDPAVGAPLLAPFADLVPAAGS